MEVIGIRELKTHASEILRRVREERASYSVTYRGRVIAMLAPAAEHPPDAARVEDLIAAFDALAEEIGRHVPPGTSVEDVMRDVRRSP